MKEAQKQEEMFPGIIEKADQEKRLKKLENPARLFGHIKEDEEEMTPKKQRALRRASAKALKDLKLKFRQKDLKKKLEDFNK